MTERNTATTRDIERLRHELKPRVATVIDTNASGVRVRIGVDGPETLTWYESVILNTPNGTKGVLFRVNRDKVIFVPLNIAAGGGGGGFPGYGGDGVATTVSRSDHTHAAYALISSLAAVAFSGAYADLTGKPTLHTHANQATLDAITAAFTTAMETKLAGIAAGAEVNVNADWNAVSGDALILNKPTLHTHANQATLDATTAAFTTAKDTKLSGIATGAEVNVNADWNAASGDAQILNKPDLSVYLTSAAAPELIRDTMGTALVAGSNITITPNDVADTITIDATGGGGGATNLTATVSPTQITVNSDTGTDAVLPAADATNAGLLLPAEKTKLAALPSATADRRLSTNRTTTVTTLAAVTDMTLSIPANQTWTMEFHLHVACTGTGGVRFAINTPAGATLDVQAIGMANAANTMTSWVNTASVAIGATTTNLPFCTLASSLGWAKVTLSVATGATAGTLSLLFASATAGQTSTVIAGSYYTARRIA